MELPKKKSIHQIFDEACANNSYKLVDFYLKIEVKEGITKETIGPSSKHNISFDPSYDNNRALRIACLKASSKVVTLLLAHPLVDPSDQQNLAFITVCLEASKNTSGIGIGPHLDVLEQLMKHPKVDPSDQHNAALHTALSNNNDRVAEILLKDARVKKKFEKEILKAQV